MIFQRLSSGIGGAGAVLCVALMAGCAHKPAPTAAERSQEDLSYYQGQVRKVVKDPQRADKLASLIGDFEKLVLARADGVKQYEAKLAALSSNYSATRADFEALAAQDDRDRNQFLKQCFALREQMASLTTDSEWEELKSARVRGLEEALKGNP